MNKVNIAAFLMALLVVGAIAAPRKVLETTEAGEAAASSEQHQRILAELEEVSALRERMLQEGESLLQFCRSALSGKKHCLIYVCFSPVDARCWPEMLVHSGYVMAALLGCN